VYASELLLRTCRRRAATCRVGRHEQAARAAAGELGRQGARHATTSRASHASRPRRALPRASHAGEPCEQAAEPGEAAHRAEATRGHGRTPAARAGLRTAPKPRRGHGRAQDAGAGVATGKNGESGRGSRARAARRAKNARAGADRGRGGGGCTGRRGAAPGATAELQPPWPSRAIQPNRAGANRERARADRATTGRAELGQDEETRASDRARRGRAASPRHGRAQGRAMAGTYAAPSVTRSGTERKRDGEKGAGRAHLEERRRRFSCGRAMGEERGVGGAICAREREEREFVGERR
jgi:hypothetical protein